MWLLLPLLVQTPMTSAILNDGTRVQCLQAKVGDVRLETPWGRRIDLSTPVLSVEDLNAETMVLNILQKNDYALWVKHASELGMISVLLEAVNQEVHLDKDLQAQYKAIRLLETWGRRLDPLSERTPAKKRLDTLWKKLTSASFGEAVLLSGRLQFLIDGPSAIPTQRIGLADLRRGLRHNQVGPRWSAVSLGSWQQEEDLWWLTGEASLKDDSLHVAQRAAEALLALGSAEAEDRWGRALWRESSLKARVMAARYLSRFGKSKAVDFLIYPLAASTQKSGGHSVFFGNRVSIVQGFDVEVAQGASIARPRVSVLQDGSSLQVRVVSIKLARQLMLSLKQLTGANPGPAPQDWLRWYENR